MNILVTGSAGYIVSHTCVALLETGHTVTVADSLFNSDAHTIDKIKQITHKEITFYQIDVTDETSVDAIFAKHLIDGIIHFAGFKAVGESVEKSLAYYYNNTVSTMVMDLSEGHVAALDKLTSGVHIYYLGTGQGTSVLQLVKAIEDANDIKLLCEVTDRRPGDIAECYAVTSKARRELGWTAKRDLMAMCDAWRFEKGYEG